MNYAGPRSISLPTCWTLGRAAQLDRVDVKLHPNGWSCLSRGTESKLVIRI